LEKRPLLKTITSRLWPPDWPMAAYAAALGLFIWQPHIPRPVHHLASIGPQIELAAHVLIWIVYPVVLAWCLICLARRIPAAGANTKKRRGAIVNLGTVALSVVLPLVMLPGSLTLTAALAREVFVDGPTYVHVVPEAREVQVVGRINKGLTERLRHKLDQHPEVQIVSLTSEGGRFYEGDDLRMLIRERGLSTYVPLFCLSACTNVFAGGTKRWLRPGAVLGFHGAVVRTIYGAKAVTDTEVRDVLIEAGVNKTFADRAQATPHAQMWLPTVPELLQAGVITGITGQKAVREQASAAPEQAPPPASATSARP